MDRVRFGILTFAVSFDDLSNLWRTAEDLGFDSAWLADDLGDMEILGLEVWTRLAAVARETARIRIGTLVSVITYRHPVLLAAQALTIDHASGGRLQLGIGSGGAPHEYRMLGLESWSPKERLDRLAEQVVILDRLLRGESATYDGRYYRVAGAQLLAPVQRPRPPLVIAAHGDRGLRLTARYADSWNSLGGQPFNVTTGDTGERVQLDDAVAATRRLSERLDEHCQEIGRGPATISRSVLAFRAPVDPLSSLDAFDEYVGRYREIGIDEIVFYWPPIRNVVDKQPISWDQQAIFERIATERIS